MVVIEADCCTASKVVVMRALLITGYILGITLSGPVWAQEETVADAPLPGIESGDLGIGNTAEFRAEALQADAASIAASKLALQRSRDPDIRDYAERVIATHKATSAALLPDQSPDNTATLTPEITLLMTSTSPASVRVALGSTGRARLERLQSAPNSDSFDRDFVAQQVRSDTRTLALYTSYARNGDSEQGRRFANEALPYIAAQLDRSNGLHARYRT